MVERIEKLEAEVEELKRKVRELDNRTWMDKKSI